ncbi:intermediate cleaving peptidase 55, mitochondrial-like [Lathyrus oleraceus]|uniref:intermediate cleaving peptidase 55, mitochondrial-like n=1 Tax=Pisum sativum TaxID=3888 RepID=UPI0021D151CF|nr:intermediate cleaving peptidase 55, mitochondrial-like [Pisum sativum]
MLFLSQQEKEGQIAGVEATLDTFKADKAYPMRKLREILPDMIRRSSKLYHNVQTVTAAYTELEAFKKLAYCNNALLLTMLHSKTYPDEGMLAAKVEYECKVRGAQRLGFNSVVGGGPNGSVIHYSRNDQKIKDGDFVLMDVGCELHGYDSDLTRTWPPCGTFSSAQEGLYELILETNKHCVELCKLGASIRQIHNRSVEMLQKGLKEFGILKGFGSSSYHELEPKQ